MNLVNQSAVSSLVAQECVPGVGDDDTSLIGLCSWLPLGGVSKWAFSSLLILSSWSSVWLLWFCWPLWGHNVGAVGQFFWAQSSVMLSGSFLIVSAPMWFTSPKAGVESRGVVLGFSLCCSSACLHKSEPLLQSTGPLALGGWHSSAKGPLGFLQFWHGVMLHLQTPSPARGSTENEAPGGPSGLVQGLEQGSWEEVLSSEAWVFMSSDVAHDLVLAFCSETNPAGVVPDDRVDAADEAFCLMDRCRTMLHWRAMTSWSHCRHSRTTF